MPFKLYSARTGHRHTVHNPKTVHHQRLRGSRPRLWALSLSPFVPELHSTADQLMSSATMLIPITSPDDGSEVQEWALVELQGRIEPMQETDLQQELRVGTMQLSKTNKDTVQLQIGYHILEGKKMALKKPMAILETVKPDREEQCDDSSSGSSSQGSTHCKVIGVLRHKYLFKTRPKALISKPAGR